MRKTTFLTLVVGWLLGCFTHLQAQSVNAFPPTITAATVAANGPNFIPPASNANRGIPMYGATIQDAFGPLHFVSFYSHDAYEPTKIARIDPDDTGYRLLNLRCGTWTGKKFVGYFVNIYTYVEQPASFAVVNFETGSVLEITNLNTPEEAQKWPTLYEMAYDHTHKKVYALGRNTENITSDLYEVNVENGQYTKVHEFDFYAWAMACDYEGNINLIQGIPDEDNELYVGSQLTRVNPVKNFEVEKTFTLTRNGSDFIPSYTHSMDMDHNANQLYWAACDENGSQYLMRIDPKTGETEATSSLGMNVISSLWIPFRGADNRDAAGKVTALRANADDAYSMTDTLTWTNPTINWRGDKLTELHSIRICRGSETNVVADIPANGKMGQTMTWIDKQPEPGYNTYYLTAMRRNGEAGLIDSVKVYVGQDVPGMVENFSTTLKGDQMELSWSAPTQGAAGKGYDAQSLTYTVVRQPGNVEIAKDLKATTLLDEKPAPYDMYYYEVTPFNAQGEGVTLVSDKMMFGKAYEPTFSEVFNTEAKAKRWSAIDNDQSGKTFNYTDVLQRFTNFTSAVADNDDYLVSPPVALKGGKTYRLTFGMELGSPDEVYDFSFTMGNGKTAEEQNIVIKTFESQTTESYNQLFTYTAKTTAPNDGRYYLALHDHTLKSDYGSYLAAKSFEIEQIFDNDLRADGLGGDLEMAKNKTANLTVKVRNYGNKAQTAYKVKVLDVTNGANLLMGEAQGTENIAPDAVIEVPVSVTPSEAGERTLVGVVELSGDENTANDRSAEMVYNVLDEGTDTWNVYINNDLTGVHTTVPMSFMKTESTAEMLYLADEIGNKGNGTISRMAFEYDSNGIAEPSEDVEVKVYMGLTDKKDYPENPAIDNWTPDTELQLVYEGTQHIALGNNQKMEFTLDTPFNYENGKNLLVQVWKSGGTVELFPALFHIFNKGANVWRSLRYHGQKPFVFDGTLTSFFANHEVPVIYLAATFNQSGIEEEMLLGAPCISYNAATRSICLNGFSAQQLTIYGIDGKIIKQLTPNGLTSVPVCLQAGVYIVKALDINGKTLTQKIAVTHE